MRSRPPAAPERQEHFGGRYGTAGRKGDTVWCKLVLPHDMLCNIATCCAMMLRDAVLAYGLHCCARLPHVLSCS